MQFLQMLFDLWVNFYCLLNWTRSMIRDAAGRQDRTKHGRNMYTEKRCINLRLHRTKLVMGQSRWDNSESSYDT